MLVYSLGIASILCKLMEHLVKYHEKTWFEGILVSVVYSNILEQTCFWEWLLEENLTANCFGKLRDLHLSKETTTVS